MGLVHKQPIHTQLLEGYHIVFSSLGLQLFQSGFQRLSGTLQLLDGKTLAATGLYQGAQRVLALYRARRSCAVRFEQPRLDGSSPPRRH